jgi:hypothetical protein
MTRARKRRRAAGVIYVEALIAIPVVVLFFFVLWQLTELFTAHLILKHAAAAAARAAAVVGPDDPQYYQGEEVDAMDTDADGSRLGDIKKAAMVILAASPSLDRCVQVEAALVAAPGSSEKNIAEVTVTAWFVCWFPGVCSDGGIELEEKARFAYQGAKYAYSGGVP